MLTSEASRRSKTKWRLANPEKQQSAIAKCMAAKPEHYAKKKADWRANNPDKVRAYQAKVDANPARKLARGDVLGRQRRYRERNRDAIRKRKCAYEAMRRLDPANRAVDALRRRIRMTCRGISKGAMRGLAYTSSDLRAHIEALFRPGMSWDNYGAWHIDHRRPVSSFALPQEMLACFALSNLQPLWATENLSKHAKVGA